MCKDLNLVPKDDYSNIENLDKIDRKTKTSLAAANGLRNRLVHRYNQTDERVAMDQRAIIEKAKKDLAFLQGHEMSDIDICIVAPSVEDKIALWREAIAAIRDDRYDLRIFELLPLYLKMAMIEHGIVVYSKDIPELYEYFYPFRRIWEDQKNRQALNREEVREMPGRAC